jgi:hypothetical protein
MKYLFVILCALTQVYNTCAQMSIEEINNRLDTRPYFKLGLDYNLNIVLPDSVQEKYAKALNRELPDIVLDSLTNFTLVNSQQYKEQEMKKYKQKCNDDSLCIQNEYQNLVKYIQEDIRRQYANAIVPNILILTAANWQIKKAIPILEKAIGDTQYDQPSVLMALAKLGDAHIKQILIDRYTLNNLLATTKEDTTSNYANGIGWETYQLLNEGYTVAIYLKNKEILLNLLDLVYVKGKWNNNISVTHIAASVISDYCYYFRKYLNYDSMEKICMDYARAIWHLEDDWSFEDKKINEQEKKELEMLLSTEYRTKIKNQMRDWVIENVNFEE